MLDGQIDVVPVAQAFESLRDRFPESVLGASYGGGELVVRVRREDIVSVLRFLKHEAGFNALTDMVGIDNLNPSATPPAGKAGDASSVPAPGAPPESVLPSGRTAEATVLPSGRTVEATVLPSGRTAEATVLPSGRTVEATVLPSGRTGDTPVKRFSVLYLLYRFPEACRIRIALDLDEAEPVESIVPIYRAADWAEREIFDMFGIVFNGHPDLRRIYLPDEFEGFPLRKDFPLEGKTGGV